jgi:hypothetical protein
MVKRRLFVFVILFGLSSIALRTAEPDTFGAGVSLSETTPIVRVIESPSDFEGKTVRVEGTVTAVCTMMGCWMALAPADQPNASTLMIKVDEGVVVLPVKAKGRRAAAQGVVERIGGDAESREAAAERAASTGAAPHAEHGKPATSAGTRWQIKATGAVVY